MNSNLGHHRTPHTSSVVMCGGYWISMVMSVEEGRPRPLEAVQTYVPSTSWSALVRVMVRPCRRSKKVSHVIVIIFFFILSLVTGAYLLVPRFY